MTRETVIQSEVSQKNKYRILTHIYIYIYIYIWTLEKWYRCIYLQGRDRDADVENGHVGMGVKGERWDELRDWS